jgi:hypothetical protein
MVVTADDVPRAIQVLTRLRWTTVTMPRKDQRMAGKSGRAIESCWLRHDIHDGRPGSSPGLFCFLSKFWSTSKSSRQLKMGFIVALLELPTNSRQSDNSADQIISISIYFWQVLIQIHAKAAPYKRAFGQLVRSLAAPVNNVRHQIRKTQVFLRPAFKCSR